MSTTCVTEGPPAGIEGSRLRLVEGRTRLGDRGGGAMSETESLVNGLAGDVDGTFERLVRVFQDRLYSFAHRLCGSREDAEEVAQDAFVRAYRALKSYPPERIRALALQAWLYRITLNVARNRRRRKRVAQVSIENGGAAGEAARRAWDSPDDPDSRPDSRLERGQQRADLASLVATLPERYRSAIILRYVEGLTLDEVADVLKQPVGTTKSNVHRAVNMLREAITNSRRGNGRAEVTA
ncbi:MAG TPA: sigma-70 family RNA polymerase sigma factor [Thermoanaerobaculia bacterium]|nr:sigma-70 family RNA polymerase sigma factor [Thermoanaerobaculia bacterium]